MATSDNNLGAPAEGFGQTVTFAFRAEDNAPSLQPVNKGRLNGGIKGGGTVRPGGTMAQGVEVGPPDPTLDLLMKIGGKVIAPIVQKKKTEAFVSGMQRAMQGEAVADIAESDPWYANIFGASDTVEGARAYTAQAKVAEQVAAMEDEMVNIRRLPPADAQKYFVDRVNANLTGDKPTDMVVLQALTRQLPAVMRRQAKEHYGWQQENAAAAETKAMNAGATTLQKAALSLGTGTTTPEEFAGLKRGFLASLVPAAGRDPENFKKTMTQNLRTWANSGQFHALNTVRESGFFQTLNPDQQLAVEKEIDSAEGRLRTKYSLAWSDDIARIKARAEMPPVGSTTADLAKDIDGIIDRYQKETGSTLAPISPTERAAYLSGSAVAIARERNRQADLAIAAGEKARTAGDKASAEAAKVQIIRDRAAQGALGSLAANKNYSHEDIAETLVPMYQAANPADRIKILVSNHRENYVVGAIKDIRVGQINAALTAEQYTPEVQQAFDEYAALRQANRYTADAYYGQHAARLEGFFNDVQAGIAPAGAFRARFVGPESRARLSKEELKEAVSVIDAHRWFLPEFAGGQAKMKPGTARRIVSEIADQVETFAKATGNTKEATKRAFVAAKNNGLEILGGYAWSNEKGQVPLFSYLTTAHKDVTRLDTDKVNEAFDDAVSELLGGIMPDEASDTAVIRLADKAGVPQFHIQAVLDGRVFDGRLSASDIGTLAAKRAEARKSSTLGVPNASLQFGPAITNTPEAYAAGRKRLAEELRKGK